jgi:hypothetical protein
MKSGLSHAPLLGPTSDGFNRPMVKIMVPQDKIQGHINRLLHFMKKLPQTRRFRNITSDKNRI